MVPDKWDNTCNVLLARQFDDAVKLDTDNKQQMEKFYIWRKRMTAMAMGANVQMLFDMTYTDTSDIRNAVDATPRMTDENKAKEMHLKEELFPRISSEICCCSNRLKILGC